MGTVGVADLGVGEGVANNCMVENTQIFWILNNSIGTLLGGGGEGGAHEGRITSEHYKTFCCGLVLSLIGWFCLLDSDPVWMKGVWETLLQFKLIVCFCNVCRQESCLYICGVCSLKKERKKSWRLCVCVCVVCTDRTFFHDVCSQRECVCVVCAVRGIVYVCLCGVYRQENLFSWCVWWETR